MSEVIVPLGRVLVRPDKAAAVPWQVSALCSQTDPDAFFPEKGGSAAQAKRVCRACEVRAECLEYALGNGEEHGIYGGLSPKERRRLGRPAPLLAAPVAPPPPRTLPIPDLTEAEAARFRSLLAPGGCGVTWRGPLDCEGRGVFNVRRGGRQVKAKASRLAWKLATGEDPAGLAVRQECGDPLCCTPGCLAAVVRPLGVAA